MDGKVKVAKRGVKAEVLGMSDADGALFPGSRPPQNRKPINPVPRRAPVTPPSAPRRKLNRPAIVLAFVIAIAMIPLTQQFQKKRVLSTAPKVRDLDQPSEKQQWRMKGLDGITEQQAVARFGPPLVARNFNVADGVFVGPLVGLKKFYPRNAPDFAARTKDAELTWGFPQFSVIREMIWLLPDSYLTLWLREPRAEVSIGEGGSTVLNLPGGEGEWTCIDNFRVGKDLVKTPPTSSETR